MPLDGKQLDELLSGFIDGELTDGERQLVEKAVRDDARLGRRIESLRRQASWVRQAGQFQLNREQSRPAASDSPVAEQTETALPQPSIAAADMAKAVLAEAFRRGRELELPATHHVQLAAGHAVRLPAAGDAVQLPAAGSDESPQAGRIARATYGSRRRLEAGLALAGLVAAAVVLLAINWPKFQQQDSPLPPANQLAQLAQRDDQPSLPTSPGVGNSTAGVMRSQPRSDNDAALAGGQAAEAAGSDLVGLSDGLAYALVVDVEVSVQAAKSRMLEKLLTAAGIPLAPPVAVNAEILRALDDSRLVVRDPASKMHPVSIQVVRGGLQELDGALRSVWQDSVNFPKVGLNLSIDSRAALMREMLRSSGDRFAPTERFAVPLAFDPPAPATPAATGAESVAAGQSSPLMAADTAVQYVSNSQRENGWESLGQVAGTTSESLATILLVIHYAD